MKYSIYKILEDIKENYSEEYFGMLLQEFEEYDLTIDSLRETIKDFMTSIKEGEDDE